MSKSGKILFQLSGSIACYKSCELISRLVKEGFEVQVVCSKSALEFVERATLEGLSGRPVLTDLFQAGFLMQHIELTRWADLAILCPATANRINQLAAGIADDLIGTMFLAWDFHKKYLIAPAMNSRMWDHPATRQAISRLESFSLEGLEILETDTGRLACGDFGEGRLLEPGIIFDKICKTFSTLNTNILNTNNLNTNALMSNFTNDPFNYNVLKKAVTNKILVTTGGTIEPIDGVRFLTNQSTGRTGSTIADHFARLGYEVTCLHSSRGIQPQNPNIHKKVAFNTFAELNEAMKAQLKEHCFAAVIHAAAVSDFSAQAMEELNGTTHPLPSETKLDSTAGLKLVLKPNPKILNHIREYSTNPKLLLVAFKLTSTLTHKEEAKVVGEYAQKCDFLVYNELSKVDPMGRFHECRIYGNTTLLAESTTNEELSIILEKLIFEKKEQEVKI